MRNYEGQVFEHPETGGNQQVHFAPAREYHDEHLYSSLVEEEPFAFRRFFQTRVFGQEPGHMRFESAGDQRRAQLQRVTSAQCVILRHPNRRAPQSVARCNLSPFFRDLIEEAIRLCDL